MDDSLYEQGRASGVTGAEEPGAETNVDFDMVRDDMADIPEYHLPAGYRFRPYREGDEETWTHIQRAAEQFFPIADDLFARQYGPMADALPARMVFVESDDGDAAATISAWWETNRDTPNDRGRIHWVAVHPAHQRRGLTKPMMTWAMARLAQDHSAAMLGTSSGRIWAVKVYLDFGFHPDPAQMEQKPAVAAAWHSVQAQLGHPLLARWLDES